MTAQPDPGGDKPQRKNSQHTMERTKLTDWKKLAQNKKLKQQMKQKAESVATSSNGAVRPGPKPWNKIKPDLSIDERLSSSSSSSSSSNIENNVTTSSTPSSESPLPGNNSKSVNHQPPIPGIIDGGRLTGFDNFENSHSRPHDNRMFKIGLGVFGAIALVLGTMLSIFYIQKKKKDEQLKRRKVRQKSPPGTYPGGGGGYPPPQIGYEAPYGDPMVNHMQMPYPAYHPQFAFQPQFDAEFNPAGYCPAEQFYNQQQYEANYYNMCQEYILQQRQMQMEANMEVYQTPQAIMGEKGYNTVMQYVEQIGDNLKTPKAKHKRNDGNSTPHPIITRRAPSMKSLAQSEISCWTEYEVENEVQEKSDLDQSDLENHDSQVENQKDDSTSTKSDSAYGSRGSIQSPNRRLKGQMATSSHMFESDHSDRDVESDRLSENVGDMSENDETDIKNNQTTTTLGKKSVSINVEETPNINTETVSVQ